jgi:hypothetical protein
MSDWPEAPADTQAAGTLHDGANVLTDGRWFRLEDFACKDGTPYPEAFADRWPALRILADAVRDLAGPDALGACLIVSGYRTPEYNARLAVDSAAHQVASGSQHVEGRAADIRAIHLPATELHRRVLGAYGRGGMPGLGGLGLYPRSNWVHVDTFKAPDGHLRRWAGT